MAQVVGWTKARVSWAGTRVHGWWARIRARELWAETRVRGQHLDQAIGPLTKAPIGTWSKWNRRLLAPSKIIYFNKIISFRVQPFKRWPRDLPCSPGPRFRRKFMTRILWTTQMQIFRSSISRSLETNIREIEALKRAKVDHEPQRKVNPRLSLRSSTKPNKTITPNLASTRWLEKLKRKSISQSTRSCTLRIWALPFPKPITRKTL